MKDVLRMYRWEIVDLDLECVEKLGGTRNHKCHAIRVCPLCGRLTWLMSASNHIGWEEEGPMSDLVDGHTLCVVMGKFNEYGLCDDCKSVHKLMPVMGWWIHSVANQVLSRYMSANSLKTESKDGKLSIVWHCQCGEKHTVLDHECSCPTKEEAKIEEKEELR